MSGTRVQIPLPPTSPTPARPSESVPDPSPALRGNDRTVVPQLARRAPALARVVAALIATLAALAAVVAIAAISPDRLTAGVCAARVGGATLVGRRARRRDRDPGKSRREIDDVPP